jgi:hypothetical protein
MGAAKDEVFSKGLLHGASYVWIYRRTGNGEYELAQVHTLTLAKDNPKGAVCVSIIAA